MTDTSLTSTIEYIAEIAAIPDRREQAVRAHVLIAELQAAAVEASRIRRDAVTTLIEEGTTPAVIAELLGVTRQRVSQIAVEGPAPEQAVILPDPGPLRICVIEKREAERGHPAITRTTMEAIAKLTSLAGGYERGAVVDTIPAAGMINLNQPNLAVLIGPRSSMLIAQALSADPVIRWAPDGNGDWYITDTRTGREYHSDFDSGKDPAARARTCYAHIGRVRRPDGQGSWLCLSGAHAPGVAGATDLLCRDITVLWEKTRKNLWSAVARITVTADGATGDVRLITPVYVHGRR